MESEELTSEPPIASTLRRIIAEHAEGSLAYEFSRAKLFGVLGEPCLGRAILAKIVQENEYLTGSDSYVLDNIVQTSLLIDNFEVGQDVLGRRFGVGDWFRLAFETRGDAHLHVVTVRVDGTSSATICFNEKLRTSTSHDLVVSRMMGSLRAFARYYLEGAPHSGKIQVNVGDSSEGPGIAYCSNRSDTTLIPDGIFLATEAYKYDRGYLAKNAVGWSNRLDCALWRGATFGHPTDESGWRSMRRVQLCKLSKEYPESLNAAFTHVRNIPESDQTEFDAMGLTGDLVTVADLNKYKYHIDIDGWASSWEGLYRKLASGSPVLKVTSTRSYRQWYYDLLEPGVNFVAVAEDLSDLMDKIAWLKLYDEEARMIGVRGKALADLLDYDSQLCLATSVINQVLQAYGCPDVGA